MKKVLRLLLTWTLVLLLSVSQVTFASAVPAVTKYSEESTSNSIAAGDLSTDGITSITKDGQTTYYDANGKAIGGASNSTTQPMTVSGQADNSKIPATTNPRKTEIPDKATASASIAPAATEKDSKKDNKIAGATGKPTYVEGEYVIKFKDNTSDKEKDKLLGKYYFKKLMANDAGMILVSSGKTGLAASSLSSLKKEAAIEYCEPNYIFYKTDLSNDAQSEPLFDQLWGLNNVGQSINGYPGNSDIDIDAPEAWSSLTGSGTVVVGVIDTGIQINHPDLAANIYLNSGEVPDNGIDDDQNGYIDDVNGWDFCHDDNTVYDINDGDYHGTHVAGTIAAAINGSGVVGVAPMVKILPIKFLGADGTGTLYDAIDAINYANLMGVKIVNCSWGGYGYSDELRTAIADCTALFVAAAGNDQNNNDNNPFYPASYDCPNIISVAAVDSTGNLANFSNYGHDVDIAAPGVNILSSFPTSTSDMGAAIYSDTGTYKTFFAGFGLEIISSQADRASFLSSVLSSFGISANSNILLVDDDEASEGPDDCKNFYISALNYNSVYATSSDISNLDLDSFDCIIWFTGKAISSSDGSPNITPDNQTQLVNYLNNGGNLYLSGRDAGWHIENTPFYSDYLHAHFNYEIDDMSSIIGQSGFSGSYALDDDVYLDYLVPYDTYGRVAYVYPGQESFGYAYFEGTSMAAPHVSGIAALLLVQNPSETSNSMINTILASAERYENLYGFVAAGRMANAGNALNFEPDDDIPGVAISATNSGTLDAASDLDDVYAFYVSSASEVKFTLSGDPETDFDIHLYDKYAKTVKTSEGILASSENIGSNETINFYVKEPGMYYLDVYGYAGSGSYTLTYEVVPQSKFDDRDPALLYNGNWTNLDSSVYANGTARLLKSWGEVSFSFTGSKITWIGSKNNTQGIAGVFIDGKTEYVNLYAATSQNQVALFEKELYYGSHTITIRWTGKYSPGAKKTATAINIDGFIINPNPAKPEAPVLQDSAAYVDAIYLRYSSATTDSINGYNIYESQDGITYTLEGTSYDGGYFHMTSTYEPRYYYATCVNSTGMESDPSSAFMITPLQPNCQYNVEDTSSSNIYTGNWQTEISQNGEYSNNTRHVTETAGDTAYIPFTTYDSFLALQTGPDMGVVRITYPFGVTFPDINLYQPTSGIIVVGFFSTAHMTNSGWTITCVSGKINYDYEYVKDIDYEAPAAPTNLTGSYAGGAVALDWADNNEMDLQGYLVYRTEAGNVTPLPLTTAPITTSAFTDSSVELGKSYTYKVVAVDYANNQSAESSVAVDTAQLTVTRYEETAATFTGSWSTLPNTANSGGNAKYSSTNGSTCTFTFTGTGIAWYSAVSTARGIASVSIDSGTPVQVDTYSTTTVYQKKVYDIQNLTPGEHTIQITVLHQKRTAATDYKIHVDAFDVTNSISVTPPAAPVQLVGFKSGITVNLSWAANSEANIAGYNIYKATTIGGPYIKINTALVPTPSYIDTLTSAGSFYYVVTAVNSANQESGYSDEISITPQTTRFEETDAAFSGSWSTQTGTSYSGGTSKLSLTSGNTCTYTFTGTGVAWLSCISPARGLASVSIDGGTPFQIDTYNSTTAFIKKVFEIQDLAPGVHTITITVLHQKSTSATDYKISIDAFDVTY